MNVRKMAISTKLIYRFNAVPIKITTSFHIELDKTVLKFIINHNIPGSMKAISHNSSTAEEFTIQDFNCIIKLQ